MAATAAAILHTLAVFMLALLFSSSGAGVLAKSLAPEESTRPVRRSTPRNKQRFFNLFAENAKEPTDATEVIEEASDVIKKATDVIEQHQDLGEEIAKLMEMADANDSEMRELMEYTDAGTETLQQFQERRCMNFDNAIPGWFPGLRDPYKDDVASASLCAWWCAEDPACEVYSYVKNTSDPDYKRCFFRTKKQADKNHRQTHWSPCCDSGLPCSLADYRKLLGMRQKQAKQEVNVLNKEFKHLMRGKDGLYNMYVREKSDFEQIKAIRKHIRELRTTNVYRVEQVHKVNGEDLATEAQLESDFALANRHATMMTQMLALSAFLMIAALASLSYVHINWNDTEKISMDPAQG